MSGWAMGWFGGGAASAKNKDAPKNAILKLRGTLEMLNKREKFTQGQIDEQDGLARKYVSSNKEAAKRALRRKKTLEHTLAQTNAQMITLEHEINTIESANINKETLDAMKEANVALKKIHVNLTPDKVDQTMEELREQHAIGDEIADVLQQGALATGAADEDELDEELAELQQEELDKQMLKTGTIPARDQIQRLPGVPDAEIKQSAAEEDEEEELRKLQAEMAM